MPPFLYSPPALTTPVDEPDPTPAPSGSERDNAIAVTTAAVNVATGAFSRVQFGQEYADNNNMWEIANPYRITCKRAGLYLLHARTYWAPGSSTRRRWEARFFSAAGAQIGSYTSDEVAPAGVTFQGSTGFPTSAMTVGQYLELWIAQDTGGTIQSYESIFNLSQLA